jgi:serine/threonine-protein kinase
VVDAIAVEPRPTESDSCPQCGHEVADAWLVCAWCGQQLAAAAELPVGTRLAQGRYQVLRVIGRGGFGITYDVGDRRLERRVAMKELFPESAVRHGSMVLTPPAGRPAFKASRDRFLREARVLARFTHPGIVRVFEVFEEHGTAYLVMELLEGRTLVELLRQHGRPFDEADVLDVGARVAAALRPVHAAGVLHRDVNPSNVMMTHHGRIVVIDFGLARDYHHDHTVGMTRVVTPGYAPIEQYRGEGRFGPATDVYGLAATLYRLATGRVPVAAIERSGGAELVSPHRLNPAISKPVGDAILDGLELEPGHRPQDIDAFLARLGVARLPEGPRARLIETVPVPAMSPTVGSTVVAPTFGDADRPAPPVAPASDPAAPPAVAPGENRTPFGAAARSGPEPRADHTVVDPAYAAGGDADRTRAGEPPAPDLTAALDAESTVHVAPSAIHVAVGDRAPSTDRSRIPVDEPSGAAEARLPLAVGPHRPGRRKLTVPLAVAAIAAGAAAPVLATALVVLVVLPLLATIGDSVAHRLRIEHGVAAGWAERRLAPGALAPVRFARNVAVSVVRAIPVLVVGAVALAGWYGLDGLDVARPLLHHSLRLLGAVVVGVLVVTARVGSRRFRTGLALDELTARWLPGGRTTEKVVVGWVLAAALVAGALWLTPSTFPL